jgi:serine/threonine protein kinase
MIEIPTHIAGIEDLLLDSGLPFEEKGPFFQVLEPADTSGWILYLSAVVSQVIPLASRVIPFLAAKQVPFTIVANVEMAKIVSDGGLGFDEVGKIIRIYPPDGTRAQQIAMELVQLTAGFKGPRIPTAKILGNIVHTQYGPFLTENFVDNTGQIHKMAVDREGKKLNGEAARAPGSWPFFPIPQETEKKKEKLIAGRYFPVQMLKSDVKGRVIKALYFKKWWQIKSCLIKEGVYGTFSDINGRDATDRVKWQSQLMQEHGKALQLPGFIDLLEEDGNSLLVMEFIHGTSFSKYLEDTFDTRYWTGLKANEQIHTLSILLRIAESIEQFHRHGLVHRDITPVNFMLEKNGAVRPIDTELCYPLDGSLRQPFQMGTSGFISPEQENNERPAPDQDVFSLGALCIASLTNLHPAHFSSSAVSFRQTLLYFTQNEALAQLIIGCMQEDPAERIRTQDFTRVLKSCIEGIRQTDGHHANRKGPSRQELGETIQMYINGLAQAPLLSENGLWASQVMAGGGPIANPRAEFCFIEGFETGIAGTLYFLARAAQCGFDVSPCVPAIQNGVSFVESNLLGVAETTMTGLAHGKAGAIYALAALNQCGVGGIEININGYFATAFSQTDASLGYYHGIAGQAAIMAKMLGKKLVPGSAITPIEQKMGQYLDMLKDSQLPDGSWPVSKGLQSTMDLLTGLGEGVGGICLALAQCYRYRPVEALKTTALRGYDWLINQLINKEGAKGWPVSAGSGMKLPYSFKHGTPGILYSMMQGYAAFNAPELKQLSEELLAQYPPQINIRDISLNSGLAGLGYLYRKAADLLQDEHWNQRAHHITDTLYHLFINVDGAHGFWIMNPFNPPTAGLLEGNSGIAHLLLDQFDTTRNLNDVI